MENYYFAGGMYYENGNKNDIHFDAVRSTGGLPYVTKNENGLQLTSHHSSLYRLSDDFTKAYLVYTRNEGVVSSPICIGLSDKLQKEFKQVIELNNFYD
jgi:hypothetical protein